MSDGTKVQPFWGRVAVAPSPVDETQLPSGLVVPDKFDGDSGVERGVVAAVDRLNVEHAESMEELTEGTVVWYRNGVRIRDVVIVDRADVLAYEIAYEMPPHD